MMAIRSNREDIYLNIADRIIEKRNKIKREERAAARKSKRIRNQHKRAMWWSKYKGELLEGVVIVGCLTSVFLVHHFMTAYFLTH